MDKQQLINKLKEGHSLVNRGSGWWLGAPAPSKEKSVPVDDQLVKQLETENIIKLEVPYISCVATLIDTKPA